MIDGYTGFLFLDKNEMPMVALHWEKYFQLTVEKHNKIYRVQLPKITPHICRHTFCSNMAKSGMNPKTLQYLMGHSDIGVTLNTYTHLGEEDAKEEMEKMGLLKKEEGKKIRVLPRQQCAFSKESSKYKGCGSLKRNFYTRFIPIFKDFGAVTWSRKE